MLNTINQYKLDTYIGDYPEDDFIQLSQGTYDFFEEFFGIIPQLKNEVFYYPANNIFLERESPNSLVAAIGNIIYKIYFNFHDENEDDCIAFRKNNIEYLAQYMAHDILNNSEIQEAEDFKLLMWRFDWGNLILELGTIYDTSYIITSKGVRHAKPLKQFKRFYNFVKMKLFLI